MAYYCEKEILMFDEKLFKNCGEEEICCPNIECQRELVKIDENLTSAILILNRKGYKTIKSCSGHIGNCRPYILFEGIYDFVNLAEEFNAEEYDILIDTEIIDGNSLIYATTLGSLGINYGQCGIEQEELFSAMQGFLALANILPDNSKQKQTAWGTLQK